MDLTWLWFKAWASNFIQAIITLIPISYGNTFGRVKIELDTFYPTQFYYIFYYKIINRALSFEYIYGRMKNTIVYN